MIKRLRGPRNDLDIAERALSQMAEADQFPEFYKHWQDFLFRIERAWEAAERDLRATPGFQQWFRPYAQQRRTDPLLVYLSQARNAETHSASATLDKPIRIMFRDKYGYPFRLSKLTSSLDADGVLTIDIETSQEDSLLSYEAALLPAPPKLVKFRCRGRWYKPPVSHLGSPLASSHPVDVARLGLSFYSAFIGEGEFRFSTAHRSSR
jgi:hypothetical protein